ncbi:MBL fold metallo-hydrolase [Xanthobacter sp. KR7-65]|uniref:MBL fold metallo-hydrolase n=1 Tax=Xanthobacter sp. KR7-65 TaxID=3156612 RepID=UPI0032B4E17A
MASRPRPSWGSGESWSAGARVKVRMYRGLLGDCFLLRFRRRGGDAFVLVDCGMFLGMQDEVAHMRAIVADIARACGSHLDVVVITHEHWDHICGFLHAADLFDQIRIDTLWLAWTEDPDDGDARALRAAHRAALALLEAAAPRIAHGEVLESVIGFFGAAAAGQARSGTIIEAMKGRADTVRYLSPGQAPLELAGVEDLCVHVLGPPRDRRLLRRSDPTRRGGEVYEFAGGADGDRRFLAAGLTADEAHAEAVEAAMPFDRKHRTDLSALGRKPSAAAPEWIAGLAATYGDDDAAWRRVDGDWLSAFEALALRLDSDTNNTSLALAFAFGMAQGAEGDVLLFPGDAQVGNWLSWGDYHAPAAPQGQAVTRDRLLARTVLYKVGHHCSHNATLRAEGLEKMTRPDLVAMVPVQEDFARRVRAWNMPFPALYDRLLQQCGGNVLRSDRSAAAMRTAKAKLDFARPSAVFDAAEDAADGLYVEVTF